MFAEDEQSEREEDGIVHKHNPSIAQPRELPKPAKQVKPGQTCNKGGHTHTERESERCTEGLGEERKGRAEQK